MSEMAPVAVVVAFVLNALSCAMAVDNAQMQVSYLEVGHREDPGPAQIDVREASGADDVVRIVRPARATTEARPSREVVMDKFKQLSAPPVRPRPAVVAFVESCAPGGLPGRQIRWGSETLPLKQRNDEQACEKHEKSVDAISAHQDVAPQNQTQLAGHWE
jgi:hypothetical protein